VRNSKEVLEAAHCIESPYDEPKAHDATDRRINWVGYKVHLVTEGCEEGFAEPHYRRSNDRG